MTWSGVFGKIPETGDFVVRRLSAPIRRGLDGWLTRHLMPMHEDWPDGGVRAIVEAQTALALVLAVPSQDRVGRRYPLAAATDGSGVSYETAEAWCDALFPVLTDLSNGEGSLESAIAHLDNVPVLRDGDDGVGAVWCAGGPPMDPGDGPIWPLISFD